MAVQIQYRKRKSWILDTLYIWLKSPDLEILPFNNHQSGSLQKQLVSDSDLKEICAQSWGHLEVFRDIISLKTSSQQPYS